MSDKFKSISHTLKKLLGLKYSPVAVSCLESAPESITKDRLRICSAILEAARGRTLELSKANNLCLGANIHLGFHKVRSDKIRAALNKFVVEGEKLFCSQQALENLELQLPVPPDNSKKHFVLSPLEKVPNDPQLVIFVVDPEAACRLLTLLTFTNGDMPEIKIGGPTCRLAVIYPLVSAKANISFYDYTSRCLSKIDKDKLLVSIPFVELARMMENIDKCCAGKARMELPVEFRSLSKKKLGTK